MKKNVLWIMVLVFVAVGCEAKAGDACRAEGICSGADTALLCVDGKYVAATCRGPGHCVSSPFSCDFRESAPGDPCSAPPDDRSVCTSGGTVRVECRNGKVEREECDGPLRCAPPRVGSTMTCDKTVRAGRSCATGTDLCSTDGKDWLTCTAGTLTVAGRCRGPGGCKRVDLGDLGITVACDMTVAVADDPCCGTTRACSPDALSVLACAGTTMCVATVCPAGKACRYADGAAACASR